MKLRLARKQLVWWPTAAGWCCLLALPVAGLLLWVGKGERFLAATARENAEVLVVEGWIGREGMHAAREEFERGGYQYLPATGGYTGEGWMDRRWSYAEMAGRELLRLGVPRDRLLIAQAPESDAQRTYQTARAAGRVLAEQGLRPRAINVLTRGTHARRSRLIYAKVMGPSVRVGG